MNQVSLTELIVAAKSGNLVSFPTDTVPALAALPTRAELIFAAKQRRADKPLILMGATPEDLWPYVSGTPEEMQIWQQVATTYWPGSLTLVLPSSAAVPKTMNPKDPTTLGIRVPDCDLAGKILTETGPMATTSANRSGQPPLISMVDIAMEFPEVFTLQATEIKSGSGLPSTVVRWTGQGWQILRQGSVNLA
jgi:L-threonylcarbamoyladenylate synthase